jgi:hypothetical protein
MRDKRYRDAYIASHTRQVLAKQMREFRGGMSQIEFAGLIGKRQTMVSRLENPAYVGWTLTTMFEIARKLNVAVFVRFVDIPTFLKLSEDMSENALSPRCFDEKQLDEFLGYDPSERAEPPVPAESEPSVSITRIITEKQSHEQSSWVREFKELAA